MPSLLFRVVSILMTDAEKIVLITVATTIFKESVFNLHNSAYLYTITGQFQINQLLATISHLGKNRDQ